MELTGALSNTQVQGILRRTSRLRARTLARRPEKALMTKPLPNRPQPVLAAVLAVLASADGPMQVRDIHTAVGALLSKPLTPASLKRCLSAHSSGSAPSLFRVRWGWYRPR
jgi:hypothetical protein